MKSLLTEPLGLYGWAGLEPVLLAALASEEPLLLVGPHGCAKSFVLERLAESLGLVFRSYNASLLNYDDLVGIPMPDESRSSLRYVATPESIWDAQVVFVDEINRTRGGHIVTIEDPIEFIHNHKNSLVSQRDVPNDAPTFARALRAALRQAPDVIMLGEMRDLETIRTAITAAETGHLLLSSLHTTGAAKTVDRILDTFPAEQQAQIRVQVSMVLRAVVSQRLVPKKDGGQVAVFEVMTVNPAIQNLIRDGRTHQIDNAIFGGAGQGMLSMDAELQRLCRAGTITRDTALLYAVSPETLAKRI